MAEFKTNEEIIAEALRDLFEKLAPVYAPEGDTYLDGPDQYGYGGGRFSQDVADLILTEAERLVSEVKRDNRIKFKSVTAKRLEDQKIQVEIEKNLSSEVFTKLVAAAVEKQLADYKDLRSNKKPKKRVTKK